jgi:hypothetical protein
MTPEQKAQLQPHLDAIAKILYEDSDPASMQTLEDIELRVREQLQAHVSPALGNFYPLSQRHAHRPSAKTPKHPRRVSAHE